MKTLLEYEKMLVSYFSKKVFKKFLLNSLPNDKILDVTKLKAFADDKLHEAQMMISVFERIENILGKGENGSNLHFLLFLQSFQKSSFSG